MCGISGILSLDGKPIKNLKNKIQMMTRLLHHRGPDQEGMYISQHQNFGLSNNRLSIVSPKEFIDLPFTKNKNEFLSFNGEIYNYLSLKDKLKKKGVNFITSTDTEVLYEFLKNYQLKDFEKINGMWSFAFYNEKKNELLLSRDLLGERHLFYSIENNELIFCSEVKPIISVTQNSNEMDFDSIVTSWKFTSCNPGHTLLKNIFRLKPGTNLHFLNGNIKINQFQKLHPEKWFDYFNASPSMSDVNKKFEEIFSKEIECRLPNDVSYYTALSGGIDSSVLAYFISKTKKQNIQTIFGISSGDQEQRIGKYVSELDSSYYVAKKFNFNHSHIYLNSDDAIKDLEFAASNSFDGCIDSGVANFSGLSKHLKKMNSKVMLFSEGPDEFLGGYLADVDAHKIDKIMGPGKAFQFLKHLSKTNLGKQLLAFILNLKKNKEFEFSHDPFYTRVNHLVSPNTFLNKIIQNYDNTKLYDYGLLDSSYKDIINNMDLTQIRALNYASKTLPDMFNLRLDKSFMQYSVEVRLPYQSVELAEFFIGMPSKFRFNNGYGKHFLRNYASKKIDQSIANRPKKGMGNYLWSNIDIYKALNFEDTIMSTDFFDHYPFKKNIKKLLIDNKTHPGNRWTAYSLIKTFENLKEINKKN